MFKKAWLGGWILVMLLTAAVQAEERFIDNGDGTVTDRKLGLMWAKTDNQGDIDWKGAERFCMLGPSQVFGKYENWRMPTLEELKSLYLGDQATEGYETDCGQKVKIVPDLQLSCGWVWTAEVKSITATVFNFHRGYSYTDRKVHKRNYRALPVRNLEAGQ